MLNKKYYSTCTTRYFFTGTFIGTTYIIYIHKYLLKLYRSQHGQTFTMAKSMPYGVSDLWVDCTFCTVRNFLELQYSTRYKYKFLVLVQ